MALSTYLVDSTVLVDLARGHVPTASWWAAQRTHALFVSTISVGELYRGIHKRYGPDPVRLALELRQLASQTLAPFGSRVLVFDAVMAERWGQIMAEGAARRRTPPTDDAKIAATALVRSLTVATSNTKHFVPLCPTIDPRTA